MSDARVSEVSPICSARGDKRIGDGAALGHDRLADFVDAGLQGARHLATAFGHDAGHLAGAHDERLVEGRRARAESAVDPRRRWCRSWL